MSSPERSTEPPSVRTPQVSAKKRKQQAERGESSSAVEPYVAATYGSRCRPRHRAESTCASSSKLPTNEMTSSSNRSPLNSRRFFSSASANTVDCSSSTSLSMAGSEPDSAGVAAGALAAETAAEPSPVPSTRLLLPSDAEQLHVQQAGDFALSVLTDRASARPADGPLCCK